MKKPGKAMGLNKRVEMGVRESQEVSGSRLTGKDTSAKVRDQLVLS
jgi:hypothetical protein